MVLGFPLCIDIPFRPSFAPPVELGYLHPSDVGESLRTTMTGWNNPLGWTGRKGKMKPS